MGSTVMDDFQMDLPVPAPIIIESPKKSSSGEHTLSTNSIDDLTSVGNSPVSWSNVGTLSFREGLSISLSYNLGISVLVFGFHIARAGSSGFMIYAFALVTTYTTAGFIAEMMYRFPEIQTYSDMGLKAARSVFGMDAKTASQFVLIFFRILQQVELFTYLIFDFLIVKESLLEINPGISEVIRLIIAVALLFPMVVFTLHPRWLSRSGIVSTVSFELLYGLIIITGLRALHSSDASHSLGFLPQSMKGFYGSYGGILLMFSGHAIYPSVFSELKDKRDMFRVLNYTYALISILSIPVALVVILGYGRESVTDLPTGYLEEGTIENWVGQVFMILKGCFTHPAILYPIVKETSQSIHTHFFSQNSHKTVTAQNILDIEGQIFDSNAMTTPSIKLKIVVSLVISTLAMFGSMFIPSIAFVLSLSSAIFAITLNLTLPSLTFAICMPKNDYPIRARVAIILCFLGLVSSVVAFMGL